MCDKTQLACKDYRLKDTAKETQDPPLFCMKSLDNQFFQSLDCSKISFFNQSNSKKSQMPPKEQLKSIVGKKRQTLAALKTLQYEELNARVHMKQYKVKTEHRDRSLFCKQDKQLIKELVRQSEVYENSINKRIMSVEERARKELLKIKQQQANSITILREQRQLEAQQKINEIRKRQQERQQSRKESLEREKELKGKTYTFEKYKTIDYVKHQRQPSPKKQLKMNEILEHQKKYRSITEQKSQSRRGRVKQFKKEFKKRSCKRYPEGRFAVILKKQKEEQRRKDYEKQIHPERYSNRISEYGKIVRELYHPRRRQKTEADESKDNSGTKKIKETRSASELKELGDSYLNYNKKHGARKSRQMNLIAPLPQEMKPVYKDYLKQIRSTLNPQGFNLRFSQMMKCEDSPQKIMRLKSILEAEERRFPFPDEIKLKELTDAKFQIIGCVL